jgi:putative peptidoglycan lipid II flippase
VPSSGGILNSFKKIAVKSLNVARGRKDPSVLADTFAVGALTVVARLAGAAKTVVSARYFGPGNDLDAYLLAFLVPSFFADVLSGALNPALVPLLIEASENGGEGVEPIYAAALYRSFAALCVLAIVLIACVFSIDPAIVGIHLARLTLARRMLLIMSPILPLSAIANVWRSVLNTEMRFSAAAFSPALTPLTAIVVLYLASRWGILVLAWGSTLGMVAEVIVLAAVLRRARLPVFPKWAYGVSTPRGAGKQYGALVASNLAMKGSTLVDQTMAAMLGQGSISILNFGTRLTAVLLTIGPAALSTTILPHFSRMSTGKLQTKLKRELVTYAAVGAAAMAVLVAVLIWFSEPIVRIAFQRGAFTAADAHHVAMVQSCSLLQAPFAVGLMVFSRFVASIKANSILLWVSLGGLGVNSVLDYFLMARYGVAGIALAAGVAQVFMLLTIASIVLRKMRADVRTDVRADVVSD